MRLDADPNALAINWAFPATGVYDTFDVWTLPDPPPREPVSEHRNEEGTVVAVGVDVAVRVFPDDGQGFFADRMVRTRCNRSRSDHTCLSWIAVPDDILNRLGRWGQARRNPGDPLTWVWLPEVRLIPNWTQARRRSDRASGSHPAFRYCRRRSDEQVQRYLDIPLWRTGNMLNKVRRCISSPD